MSPKRGGEPKRKVSDTAKRHSILVFTEGVKTEPVYFTHWSLNDGKTPTSGSRAALFSR